MPTDFLSYTAGEQKKIVEKYLKGKGKTNPSNDDFNRAKQALMNNPEEAQRVVAELDMDNKSSASDTESDMLAGILEESLPSDESSKSQSKPNQADTKSPEEGTSLEGKPKAMILIP